MASILKVDTIQDQSGNNIINENADTITIGASGDTITVPTGATLTVPSGGLSGQNYPAFEAYLSASQSVTDNVETKVQIDTVDYDIGGYFDNSTNYRYTPLVAGKYFVYTNINTLTGTASTIRHSYNSIFKSGSRYKQTQNDYRNNDVYQSATYNSAVIDMNGTTDYLEIFGNLDATGGTPGFDGGSDRITYFGAYRIGD